VPVHLVGPGHGQVWREWRRRPPPAPLGGRRQFVCGPHPWRMIQVIMEVFLLLSMFAAGYVGLGILTSPDCDRQETGWGFALTMGGILGTVLLFAIVI